MPRKPSDEERRRRKALEALAESAWRAPWEELAKEIEATGRTVGQVAARMRAAAFRALADFESKLLENHRQWEPRVTNLCVGECLRVLLREGMTKDRLQWELGCRRETLEELLGSRELVDDETMYAVKKMSRELSVRESALGIFVREGFEILLGRGGKGRASDRPMEVKGRSAAGNPMEAVEDVEGTIGGPEYFGVRVVGDSMRDAGYRNGDVAILRTASTAEDGEIALVYIDGEATIKQIYRVPAGLRLVSANPDYPEKLVRDSENVRIGGIVVGRMAWKG